jgi:integrase/recombinase XerD
LRWATGSAGTQTWSAARLSVVRGFARYLHTLDPATEVPPAGLLTYRRRRARPYLYSDADIGRLLSAALDLTPAPRAATSYTMLGLLAVTGMRVGEVIRLDRDDVDLQGGLLRVWMSKFGKSREVPVHPSTVTMLARYANLRNEAYPRPKHPSFFLTTWATRPDITVVHKTFRLLCRRAGLEDPNTPGRPRIHDLRHTWRCARCWTGTPMAWMCRPGCRGCPPTAATWSRPRRTGTSRPRQSSWPWPRNAWQPPLGNCHE